MVVHGPQYNQDIGEAERRAQRMRRGSDLGRVLWLLNEKADWNLTIGSQLLSAAGELARGVADIRAQFPVTVEAPPVDLSALEEGIQRILDAISILGPEPGPATSGSIVLDGTVISEGDPMDSVKDNAGPKSLSVAWNDEMGAVVTNEAVDETWTGDNDAVATVGPDPDDASKAIFTPVGPGVVNVTVKGINQGDQSEVELSAPIEVTVSDAVAGTISLADIPAPE